MKDMFNSETPFGQIFLLYELYKIRRAVEILLHCFPFHFFLYHKKIYHEIMKMFRNISFFINFNRNLIIRITSLIFWANLFGKMAKIMIQSNLLDSTFLHRKIVSFKRNKEKYRVLGKILSTKLLISLIVIKKA